MIILSEKHLKTRLQDFWPFKSCFILGYLEAICSYFRHVKLKFDNNYCRNWPELILLKITAEFWQQLKYLNPFVECVNCLDRLVEFGGVLSGLVVEAVAPVMLRGRYHGLRVSFHKLLFVSEKQ